MDRYKSNISQQISEHIKDAESYKKNTQAEEELIESVLKINDKAFDDGGISFAESLLTVLNGIKDCGVESLSVDTIIEFIEDEIVLVGKLDNNSIDKDTQTM